MEIPSRNGKHYPVPCHLLKSLNHFGYKKGDFPITDSHAEKIISFPCDQHLSQKELDYIIDVVTKYYEL